MITIIIISWSWYQTKQETVYLHKTRYTAISQLARIKNSFVHFVPFQNTFYFLNALISTQQNIIALSISNQPTKILLFKMHATCKQTCLWYTHILSVIFYMFTWFLISSILFVEVITFQPFLSISYLNQQYIHATFSLNRQCVDGYCS